MNGDEQAVAQLERTRQAAELFFHSLSVWLQRQPNNTGRVREQAPVANVLSEELRKLASNISRCASALSSEEERIELTSAADRCSGHAATVDDWLGQNRKGHVYWIEARGDRQNRLALASAPIAVGPELQERLYTKVPSVIMTSATLSSGGSVGFAHAQKRLGIFEGATLQVGSPFNYREQVELHLYRKMPDPTQNASVYENAVLEKLPAQLERG